MENTLVPIYREFVEENVPLTAWNWKTPPTQSVPEQPEVLYLFEMQKWK